MRECELNGVAGRSLDGLDAVKIVPIAVVPSVGTVAAALESMLGQ